MTPDSSNAQLALAASVDIDSKGLNYLFTLKNAYYSNGEMITAYDFENSWKEALHPDFFCPNSHLFFAIKNAKNAKLGLAKLDEVGVKAIDHHTLQVTLEHPFKPFLEVIAFSTFAPFKREDLFSGPYIIESYSLHSHLQLTPNPYYAFENRQPPLPIEISFLKDEMTALNLFEKEQLHLIGTPFSHIPKDAVEELKKKYRVYTQPNLGICYLIFNQKNPLLQQRALLQSIHAGIDRKSVTSAISNIEGKEISFIIPHALVPYHLEVEKSESFEPLVPHEPLRFIYPANSSYSKIAQVLQEELTEKWQLSIQLQPLEPKLYIEKLRLRDYDIALNTLFAQYKDPMSILERFDDPSNPKNYPCFDSLEYRQKILESHEAIDDKTRLVAMLQAEKILLETAGLVPLFETQTTYCISKKIEGVQVNTSGGFNFQNVRFSQN